MCRKKLSGDVRTLNTYIDKKKQVDGERTIKNRKRQEQKLLNLAKFKKEIK